MTEFDWRLTPQSAGYRYLLQRC